MNDIVNNVAFTTDPETAAEVEGLQTSNDNGTTEDENIRFYTFGSEKSKVFRDSSVACCKILQVRKGRRLLLSLI